MLHSMTGFARQSEETPIGTLTWEIRTVNHRYLDVQFRMPDELRPKEQQLKQRLGESLKRGKVECSLHFKPAIDQQSEMTLNRELIDVLGARVAEVNAALSESVPVDPIDILRWPGVLQEPEIDAEPLIEEASKLFAKTLSAIAETRASEGGRIEAMLDARCTEIGKIAATVRRRLPEVMAAARAKQKERLAKLDIDADPDRLEVELALVAQKLDVDEELDRLESHVVEIRHVLGSNEPVGRRLDFLMQELNREANTLGSKSADAETTKAAVELKVLIEQMREQIQNVE